MQSANAGLMAFFTLALMTSPARAEPATSPPLPLNKALIKQIKKQGRTLISDRVGGYILRAEDLAGAKKYGKAIELLEHHYKKKGLSQTEKALFAFHLGQLNRQSGDKNKSFLYLKEALDSKALPYPQHLSALYSMAQIRAEEENYDKALELLRFWLSINERPFPSAYILLAHCHYAKGRLDKALKFVEKTLSLIDKPMESWLSFAAAIHLKRKSYNKAMPYLERLTALYPARASHWKQLAGVYLLLGQNAKAFVTLDMADKMSHLKRKNEYLNLSSLYIDQGLPYQGAMLLREKIDQKLIPKEKKNLELLAEAFWMARERNKSLDYLKLAGAKAVEPVFFIKYGQRLLDQEKWKEAEKAFKKALKTKKIKETIQAIKNYKKELAEESGKKRELRQSALFQAKAEEAQRGGARAAKQPDPESSLKAKQPEREMETSEPAAEDKLKAPPTNYLEHIYFGIAVSFYHREKYEEALFYFKKSIEADDTFISGYQWIDWTETALLEKRKKTPKKTDEKSA